MSGQLEHEAWRGNTAGMNWMHRTLIWTFKFLNLRFVYLGMAVFVVPFYMLFAHRGYISMYHYFRQRQGYGVWKSFRYVYLNHYRFGQIILDRFAVYAGREFQFEIDGNDQFVELCHGESGFMVLSCHVGNYELAGYAFKATEKRYNALVFSGEAKEVMENRNRVLSRNNIHMIPVSEDMSHLILMSDALSSGEIVSIPADRVFGSPRYVECDFLGSRAHFPLGPYMLAIQRGVPTLAILVMKESAYRYQVYVRRVQTDDRKFASRQEKAANLAQHFAQEVEAVLRQYPEQWFNYYEFWNHDTEQ
jgi:predicted LPLAT superfamily acyltransferase